MNKYIAINVKSETFHCVADSKKELLEILTEEHATEGTPDKFFIAEIIDTISISTKKIVEATLINSEGKEVKVDARDRLVPTERVRAPTAEEEVIDILEKIGLGEE